MAEEAKTQRGWNYDALKQAAGMGALPILCMSLILNGTMSGAAGMAIALDILIGLRVLGAFLFKEQGNGWKYYYVLLVLAGPVCLAFMLIMQSLSMRFEFF